MSVRLSVRLYAGRPPRRLVRGALSTRPCRGGAGRVDASRARAADGGMLAAPVVARLQVSCLYACTNMTAAAFLPEWDAWREAGVRARDARHACALGLGRRACQWIRPPSPSCVAGARPPDCLPAAAAQLQRGRRQLTLASWHGVACCRSCVCARAAGQRAARVHGRVGGGRGGALGRRRPARAGAEARGESRGGGRLDAASPAGPRAHAGDGEPVRAAPGGTVGWAGTCCSRGGRALLGHERQQAARDLSPSRVRWRRRWWSCWTRLSSCGKVASTVSRVPRSRGAAARATGRGCTPCQRCCGVVGAWCRAGLAGSGGEVVVLLAGVSGDVASSISKKLTARGVNHERILFADQF